MTSPEQRLLNEVARMDQAATLYERLEYVSQLRQEAIGPIERELTMECLDEMLDFANEHNLSQVLGEIALIRAEEGNES